MKWFPLKTEEDYKKALDRVEEIIDYHPTECLSNELHLLSFLIDKYEGENYPME